MDPDEQLALELMVGKSRARLEKEKKKIVKERASALLGVVFSLVRVLDEDDLEKEPLLKQVWDLMPKAVESGNNPSSTGSEKNEDNNDDDDEELEAAPPQREKSKKREKEPKKRKEKEIAKQQPKRPARKKAAVKEVAKVGEEESEEENEEEMELETDSAEIVRLFEEAEKEFDEVLRLSKNFPGQVGVERVEAAPSPETVCDAMDVNDDDDLRKCFCDTDVPLLSIEGVGVQLSWYRLVTRACQVGKVFSHIRSQKGDGRRIQKRYADLSKRVQGDGFVLSFVQATKYDRLGKFLLEFPKFVLQRKFVRLADWLQTVDDHGVMIDSVVSLLPLSSVFLRDCFELHRDGFQIYPSVMKDSISETLVDLCMEKCDQEGDVLFNNDTIRSRLNDKKRLQLAVSKVDNDEVSMFERLLVGRLKTLFPSHKPDSAVILLSRDGCAAQLAHTDYSPATLENVMNRDAAMPLAVLVALTDNTVMDVWPKAIRFDKSQDFKPQQIRLQAGDVLAFRADLVHGGAAVANRNVRMHVYLDTEAISRPKYDDGQVEQTNFMHKFSHILSRKKEK